MTRTVLLIEDNEQNRTLATFLLEQRRAIVLARDFVSAIEAFGAHASEQSEQP